MTYTPNERRLRKNDKKIRNLEKKDNLDQQKLNSLQKLSEELKDKITCEKKEKEVRSLKQVERRQYNKMSDNEIIDSFIKENEIIHIPEKEIIIENTASNRRRRKKIIGDIKEKEMESYMNKQIEMRREIIWCVKEHFLKKQKEESKAIVRRNKKSKKDLRMEEFMKVRKLVESHFTS